MVGRTRLGSICEHRLPGVQNQKPTKSSGVHTGSAPTSRRGPGSMQLSPRSVLFPGPVVGMVYTQTPPSLLQSLARPSLGSQAQKQLKLLSPSLIIICKGGVSHTSQISAALAENSPVLEPARQPGASLYAPRAGSICRQHRIKL